MRKAFQATMRHDLIDGIERPRAQVVAWMSDNHIDPDVAVEVFLLAPTDAGPQSTPDATKTASEAIAGASASA